MAPFRAVCTGLMAAAARAQCDVETSLAVSSTEEAATLAASLQLCSNGSFAVEWTGEVSVVETISVTGGTSLTITGAQPDAVADGGGSVRLFVVERGSSLHLSDMTVRNGYTYGDGGAILAEHSTVSFSGSISFLSNSAASNGGALNVWSSTVSWVGDYTEFSDNFAGGDGGAIYLNKSAVSWDGNGTKFIFNSAYSDGGAMWLSGSDVAWRGDYTEFSSNSAIIEGAISASSNSTVSWSGDATKFSKQLRRLVRWYPPSIRIKRIMGWRLH